MTPALVIAKLCAQCPYCRWVILVDPQTHEQLGQRCQHYNGIERINGGMAVKFMERP